MRTDRPSETAQAVAAVAHALPQTTRRELRRLVAYDIAAPAPERRRALRLGLLAQLVAQASPQVPASADYETLRADRTVRGEEWPSRSQLARDYGHWLKAVAAASQLDAGYRVITERPSQPSFGSYSRRDALNALERCRKAVGGPPTQTEYEAWARLVRRQHSPVPGLSVVRRHFGTWERALSALKRHAE